MTRLALAALILPVWLAACAPGSPGAILGDTPDQLSQEDTLNLCNAYGLYQGAPVRAELTRRNAITALEWPFIDAKQVTVGMSECAVIAALGQPDTITTSNTAKHHREKFTYKKICPSCDETSLTFTDGILTGTRRKSIIKP